jgi:hypothetical protein
MGRSIAEVRTSRFNIVPLTHKLVEQLVQCISGAQQITATPKQKGIPRIRSAVSVQILGPQQSLGFGELWSVQPFFGLR